MQMTTKLFDQYPDTVRFLESVLLPDFMPDTDERLAAFMADADENGHLEISGMYTRDGCPASDTLTELAAPKPAELAADTLTGVYICEITGTDREYIEDWDFHAALAEDFDGTIYGIVSDPDCLAAIESDYGII